MLGVVSFSIALAIAINCPGRECGKSPQAAVSVPQRSFHSSVRAAIWSVFAATPMLHDVCVCVCVCGGWGGMHTCVCVCVLLLLLLLLLLLVVLLREGGDEGGGGGEEDIHRFKKKFFWFFSLSPFLQHRSPRTVRQSPLA